MIPFMDATKEKIEWSPPAFPSEDDMRFWESLTAGQQRELVERAEQAGFDSGIAEPEEMAVRLKRVRARGGDGV